VGNEESLVWAGRRPGFMTLVVRHDGGVVLQVTAAPPEALRCDDEDDINEILVKAALGEFCTCTEEEIRDHIASTLLPFDDNWKNKVKNNLSKSTSRYMKSRSDPTDSVSGSLEHEKIVNQVNKDLKKLYLG